MITFIKFIHLIFVLILPGLTLAYFFLKPISTAFKCNPDIVRNALTKILLYSLSFALITGTLLVYPKHFTFHTPWIMAAYLLVFTSGTLLFIIKKMPVIASVNAGLLLPIFFVVIHDAVSKQTFLSFLY